MNDFNLRLSVKTLKNIIQFLFTFILILFVIEFYFRASGVRTPAYFYDSKILGRTQTPGREIFKVDGHQFCIDKVNKYGYTGNGYPLKKGKNTIRIALFGDSFTEALQVFRRNRFSTIMERELSKKLKKKVEVLDFGLAGDDFRGMYFRYLKMGIKYNPDYSIFIVQGEAFYNKKQIPTPDIYLENDSLKISYAYIHNSASKVRNEFELVRGSAIGNLFKDAYSAYSDGRLPSIILDKIYPFFKVNSDRPPDLDRFLKINKKIIDTLAYQNKIDYNKIVIVKMDTLTKFYENYLKIKNFPEIDLNKFLIQHGGKEKLNYWKAGKIIAHWNNFGHHLIGEFLARKIYDLMKTNN